MFEAKAINTKLCFSAFWILNIQNFFFLSRYFLSFVDYSNLFQYSSPLTALIYL